MFKLLLVLFISDVYCYLPDYCAVPTSVERFREYLTIDTSEKENIEKAAEFWKDQAHSAGLPVKVYEPNGMPIVVITWEGQDPTLPSIMLNSHMDVVAATEEEWTHPPFSGYIDETGDIYGRGTQDTKDVAMQYIEAIRRLKNDGVRLLRTVHITLMPDEETGGDNGMKSFVKTTEFEALNIGFALDEGLSSPNDTLIAFYQDRRPWQMEFTVFGEGAHGFAMPDENAADKASKLIQKVLEFRSQNMEIMKSRDAFDFGSYTSVNVNILKGGSAVNVIPNNMTIGVDMRLSADSDVQEINDMVNSWMLAAGSDTRVYYLRREEVSEKTILDDSNLYWTAMKDSVHKMGYNVTTLVCPATSDMLVLRNLGFPAVGFAPKVNTVNRIHGNNEYINVKTFLRGIDIYYEIIKNIANVPDFVELSIN